MELRCIVDAHLAAQSASLRYFASFRRLRPATGDLSPVEMKRAMRFLDYSEFWKFIQFGTVGLSGFVLDTTVLYSLLPFTGMMLAATFSFIAASSLNWLLNRIWTFRDHARSPAARQWLLFVVASSLGFVVNRGTLFFSVSANPLFLHYPVLGVMAGTAAGLVLNYGLTSRFVFIK